MGVLALYAGLVVVGVMLTMLALWPPRRAVLRWCAVTLAVLALPTLGYASLVELLARPKPMMLETRGVAEAEVLHFVLREGEAIWVWLALPELSEPRAYVMPWSLKLARELHEADRTAGERDGKIEMRRPFERSWDEREPRFYARPQPALPPKQPE